jgi:hypothetical protein
MNRNKIRDLALVALASGLLAFEVTSLRGALPGAIETLAEQGVLADVQGASRGAAIAVTTVLRSVGSATTEVAVGAEKGAAQLLGTVTPPARSRGAVMLADRDGDAVTIAHAIAIEHTCAMKSRADLRREIAAAQAAARRAREIRREIEAERRGSAL